MNTILTKQIVPISDFRIHQGKTLEKMAAGPVYLAQRSKPVAVLVASDQWDSAMIRLQMLDSMFAQQEFDRQFADIQAGNCPPEMTSTDLEAMTKWTEEKQQAHLVALPKNLLNQIDDLTDTEQDLSSFLEAAAWAYVTRMRRAEQNARDLEIINGNAEYLNSEAMDVLEYQADL